MTYFDSHRVFRRLLMACLVVVSSTYVPVSAVADPRAVEAVPKAGKQVDAGSVLTVEGISVQGDDDDPRVLNILPWQPPTVSRRTRDPLRLEGNGLLEPVDPEAMRRHRRFRQTLNPLRDMDPGH